jgi:hypothetical protein
MAQGCLVEKSALTFGVSADTSSRTLHGRYETDMSNSIRVDQAAGQHKQTPLIKKIGIVFSMMSVVAGTLTGIMTWANLGFSDAFMTSWGRSFVMALVVMMPVAGLLIALIGALVKRALSTLTAFQQNLITGLVASVIMQSLMAVITAFNAVGFSNWGTYLTAWSTAFVTAFPVGLALALILTTLIKPRLEVLLKS